MVTKKDYATDEAVNGAGISLANEPSYTANIFSLAKLKKIKAESKYENLKSVGWQNNPQNRSTGLKIPKDLKRRKHREMKKTVFGYELIMDLSQCNLAVMSSKMKLAEYVEKLCKLIKMKKYGKTHLPYFGLEKPHTKGYSLLQFIETSSITGHFSEYWGKSYINIFSCKTYDHKLAANFTKDFFGAKRIKTRFIVR
jgi:S-adenosylmethionine/arginine decarboxylase-like enzyme